MKLNKRSSGWIALAALLLTMPLIGCGGNPKLLPPVDLAGPIPVISDSYAALLKQAPDDLKRAAIQHEDDWRGWAKKAQVK